MGSVKQYGGKIVSFFIPIHLNICYGCSKEPSHGDGSFEYPQHMLWLRNKKNILFQYAVMMPEKLFIGM